MKRRRRTIRTKTLKMEANHSRNQNRKAAEVLTRKELESKLRPMSEVRIRTALTKRHEKFGNESKANG